MLVTISGFAFAGVKLGTLNHQWVCLCWSHAWELLTISGFAFAGVMLGTLNHQWFAFAGVKLVTISGLPLLESCLELSTISGFAFAGVMLGTLNHQWVCLCWSHALNS